MKIFENLFLKNNQKSENPENTKQFDDGFVEIGKLLKEARIKKNFTIEELSGISRIPENIINSIENNIENIRPKNPFIRSILFKLEECLSLRKNTLVGLLAVRTKSSKIDERKFIVRNFDFINSWEGIIIYFLILIFSIFVLKRYIFFNMNIIEIQNIEEKINEK